MKASQANLTERDLTASTLPESTRVNGKRPITTRKTARSAEAVTAEGVTQVEAKIDVGWGNTLFIRGEGAGLSWDKGTPMACLDATTWIWLTTGAGSPVRFKLLINDELWAGGDDLAVAPGACIEVKPAFPSWAR